MRLSGDRTEEHSRSSQYPVRVARSGSVDLFDPDPTGRDGRCAPAGGIYTVAFRTRSATISCCSKISRIQECRNAIEPPPPFGYWGHSERSLRRSALPKSVQAAAGTMLSVWMRRTGDISILSRH
jgi:hypothetical protein